MATSPAPEPDDHVGQPGSPEIAALVERAQSGDRSALELLWRGQRRWVTAILIPHAPRGEDLEDLLQEVALRVVHKIGDLRDRSRFRGWLRTVALNVARSAGRRAARLASELSVDPDLADDRIRSADGQADTDAVLEAIAELTDEYREPLVLRCVHGFSQREIARELGITETTVETRLARARRKIRERLGRHGLLPHDPRPS